MVSPIYAFPIHSTSQKRKYTEALLISGRDFTSFRDERGTIIAFPIHQVSSRVRTPCGSQLGRYVIIDFGGIKFNVLKLILYFNFILFLPLPHKQPQYQKQNERNIYGLEAMQKEIHSQNCHERGEQGRRKGEYSPGDGRHDGTEEDESDDSSFDELLDIPALRNVVVFCVFDSSSIDWCIGEFRYIAVGRSGCSESLSHRVFTESLDSSHSSVKMPLRGSCTHNNLINSPFIPEVEES